MISLFIAFVREHFLILLFCALTAFIWPNIKNDFHSNYYENINETQTKSSILTQDRLATFDGIRSPKLYLAILGKVYDVSTGSRHYQVGESYHYFVGRDASVAFITGDFEETDKDNEDVLRYLSAQEILSVSKWQKFYEKQYPYIGKVIGRFYDHEGKETEYLKQVEDQIALAIDGKAKAEELKQQFPACNIEWKENTGTRVWCSNQSGGVFREWIGVPRKFFQMGQSDFRCICASDDKLADPRLKEYNDCDPKATECFYRI